MSHLVLILIMHFENILRHGGYWVIGLSAVVEALPLIGSVVPGHTIVIFGGFFAHLGFLNVYLVMLLAGVGAIMGDIISFILGRKYGLSFITKWGQYFLLKEKHIESARAALNKHSGKAIIFGRFNPVARTFIPFLAGASGVPMKKFWIFDGIAAVSWAVISVAVGFLFGASFQLIASVIGKFTTVGIVLAILLVAAYFFVNKRRHIFAKYDFHILIVCIIALYFFFKTVQDVFTPYPFMEQIDVAINMIMASHVVPWLVLFMKIVSYVLSPTVLGIAVVCIGAWWTYKKHMHNVYIFLASYPLGLLFGYLLKAVVDRERPLNGLVFETTSSFPSEHALAAGLFFTLIVYFYARYIKNRHLRELFIVGNVFLVALVCISRVYLNVHWFSDVLAGSMFGIFWATFSILTVRYVEGLVRGRGAKGIK